MIRSMFAMRSLSLTIWAALTKCDFSQIACFVAFLDMRGGRVCVLHGRRNTLEACQC